MKTTINLSRGGRSAGRDLNPGRPEYEGVLTTQQRRSVNKRNYRNTNTWLIIIIIYYKNYDQ
jgi:hypothetical protein